MPLETMLGNEICDVAIVGSGPSGLSLATELRRLGVDRVLVLEREADAGGVPRHCGHYPFGVHEHRRLMKGPAYARRHVADAEAAGVEIRRGVAVMAIGAGGRLEISSDKGTGQISARRVALCTGARESSRAQRFIGGARQRGVMTTGALQAFVYLEGVAPFRRPAVLGTELVSFSSLLTCRHAGIRPVAMIEPNDRITVRAFARALPAALGVPVLLGARVSRILGQDRVEGVEIVSNGETRAIEADGVICTGQFRPESALLRSGHLAVDPATGGPVVDQYGRASDPAYFCAGNLLRPIETSTWCAREGREAALRIAQDLKHGFDKDPPTAGATPMRAAHRAIRYVLPQLLSQSDAPGAMSHAQLRLARSARGRLVVHADGREAWSAAIDSRPERRILAPLDALAPYRGATAITFTIEER